MTGSFKTSELSFSCFLDSRGKCVYSSNPAFFRKILTNKKFRAGIAQAAEDRVRYEQSYTSDGVKYNVSIYPVAEDRFLVYAYPEEGYIRFSYSEMYMRLFTIKKNANSFSGALERLKGELVSDKASLSDEMRIVDELDRYSGEILVNSDSVLELFDAEHISRYVNIFEKLHHTEYCIKRYNDMYRRNVVFDIDVTRPVAKVNYTVLEVAVYRMAVILYKALSADGNGIVKISENKNGDLVFKATARLRKDFDVTCIDNDIRDIACAVESLGGSSEVGINRNGIVIKAIAPVHLSNYIGRIKNGVHDSSDDSEILSGYSFVITPGELGEEVMGTELTLNSPRREYKTDFSYTLADIMLGELVFDDIDFSA